MRSGLVSPDNPCRRTQRPCTSSSGARLSVRAPCNQRSTLSPATAGSADQSLNCGVCLAMLAIIAVVRSLDISIAAFQVAM
jgi:hypothetical protein